MKSTVHPKRASRAKREAKEAQENKILSLATSEASRVDILGSESSRSKIDPVSSMDAALAAAIRASDVKAVESLLARGVSLAPDGDGLTPLMLAARENSAECVRLLLPLSRREDEDAHGCTALMFAASNGHSETLMVLLPGSKISAKGRDGYSIWRQIGKKLALDTIAPFLKTLTPEQVQELDEKGDSLLMIAAETGQPEAIKAILGKGDPNKDNEKARNPLLLAVEKGHGACVRLLAPVSDCSKTVKDGETALMRAIAVCSVEAVEALLPFSNPDAVTKQGFDAWHFCELMFSGRQPGAAACADAVGSHWLTEKTINFARGLGSQYPKKRMAERKLLLPRIFAKIEAEALSAVVEKARAGTPSTSTEVSEKNTVGTKRI